MRGKSVMVVIGCLLATTTIVLSYSTGPPDKRTGAPGESTCAGCHGNLNVGSGSVHISGMTSYLPGDTLSLAIVVSQQGQITWGFECTVLDTLDQFVGTILRTDSLRTQLTINANGRYYIKHTHAGIDSGVVNTSPGWQFRWIPPSNYSGPVTFYAAGNAADGSGDPTGDYIYTTTHKLSSQGICCVGTTGNVDNAGIVDLSDLSLLILYLISTSTVLPCPVSANVNAAGVIDLSDLSALILYLTDRTYQLPSCPQ